MVAKVGEPILYGFFVHNLSQLTPWILNLEHVGLYRNIVSSAQVSPASLSLSRYLDLFLQSQMQTKMQISIKYCWLALSALEMWCNSKASSLLISK